MTSRYLSRKFITTLAAQIAAMLVLWFPEHEQPIVAAAQHLAALAVLLGSALGYIAAEASIDRQAASPGETKRGSATRSELMHARRSIRVNAP